MTKKDNQTKEDEVFSTKGLGQSNVNRRQFMAATGALLGTAAVGTLAFTKAQPTEAGTISDDKKAATDHTAAKPAMDRGPWEPALEKLREWDPKWAEAC